MSLTKEQPDFIALLYQEMYRKLVATAYGLLGNMSLAEEVAQDAFLIACRKAEDVMNCPNPQGWMIITLHNVVRNLNRVLATQERYLHNTNRSQDQLVHVDDYSGIEYSDLLSIEEYRLFRRIAVDNYSMSEAAVEFGISVEACKKRVQRIRVKMLRQMID